MVVVKEKNVSRLNIMTPDKAQGVMNGLYGDVERRLMASPPGVCPVDMSAAFLRLCHAQTCGKCVPCRVGLGQLAKLIDDVLEGRADMETIPLIEKTARVIKNSADCAIGREAAEIVLRSVVAFRDDFESHIKNHRCLAGFTPVPCVAMCPANVDIPGYVSLVNAGRYADAVRLIRKDNPFPTTCGLICEHPCENRCRRNMVDAPVNIRGLKRYATEHAGNVPVPACAESTGKTIGIIGGGPAGLTAAYFLALMGHKVEIYEKRQSLGGMLRYGIPSYRLPRERLDDDINAILSTGAVTVKKNVDIGKDITIKELKDRYDALYIAIGAHTDKKLGIEGEDLRGVMSAVTMLRGIGDGSMPDFKGKNVVIVGGGNVAMDCTRSAKRLGAKTVTCVYRRRIEDMTALMEEVEGAMAEGCEVMQMMAPVKVKSEDGENVSALVVQPQIIGEIDKSGRPKPYAAKDPEVELKCDIVVVAIGQNIETEYFTEYGVPVKWGCIQAKSNGAIENFDGVFSGGDCVTGPATVIRAIAAGKVAAANIDEYLGFKHEIKVDVEIPEVKLSDKAACGRVGMKERPACERSCDFAQMETGMSLEEANQESSRCLRCDHYGYGIFKGGRETKW
jgi:NADPH-dependent glutamate synthase beta subunit-like oxidoreductase